MQAGLRMTKMKAVRTLRREGNKVWLTLGSRGPKQPASACLT